MDKQDELTPDYLSALPNAQLAFLLTAVALGVGDKEAARVCKEAADRFNKLSSSDSGASR